MKTTATDVLERLRDLGGDDPWRAFDRRDWPELFRHLAVAADLPRLADSRVLDDLPAGFWPSLAEVAADVRRLQRIVDRPVVPDGAREAVCRSDVEAARCELDASHCVTVDFLLDPEGQGRLDALVAELAAERDGQWGQLERDAAPDLFDLFDQALAGERFRRLTGFDPGRDAYTLTLSLQDLDAAGIGWHRDLYWPREWVGEDVFAVLYGLGDDTPEKGGAFLYYVPWDNALHACYRRRHQATVLWNSRDDAGRLLHAVSRYLTGDTSRHLVILQCLRRAGGGAGRAQ